MVDFQAVVCWYVYRLIMGKSPLCRIPFFKVEDWSQCSVQYLISKFSLKQAEDWLKVEDTYPFQNFPQTSVFQYHHSRVSWAIYPVFVVTKYDKK